MTTHATEVESVQPELDAFDEYASYEDDGAVVICDRMKATAWIRSDTVTEILL